MKKGANRDNVEDPGCYSVAEHLPVCLESCFGLGREVCFCNTITLEAKAKRIATSLRYITRLPQINTHTRSKHRQQRRGTLQTQPGDH